MIHPAIACNPCKHGICEYEGDCETCIAQDRIRELEAELAEVEEKGLSLVVLEEKWRDMKARAEKAEKEAERIAGESLIERGLRETTYMQLKKTEARVAELEKEKAGTIPE